MRMLYCPALSPESFSRRLPGGTRRASNRSAASSIASLRQATRCTEASSLRDLRRSQTASVPESRTDRSTLSMITHSVINAQRYHGVLTAPHHQWRAGSGRGVGYYPHGEVLRAATVGVPECGARASHLMRAGLAHDLHGRFGKPEQPGRPDRGRAEHTDAPIDRNQAADFGLACLGELPPFARSREP